MSRAPSSRSATGRSRVGAVAVAVVLAAACSSNVPRDEIIAAAGGQAGTSGGAVATGSSGGTVSGGSASAGAGTGAVTDGAAINDTAGTADPAGATGTPDAGTGASAGSGPAAGGAANGSVIRLGHIGHYSGLLGAIAQGGDVSVQAWAQWVNANGGLNGHPVEVIVADDRTDPDRALTLVRDMVENRGVVAFVGGATPLTLGAYLPYLEQNRIPEVGGSSASTVGYSSTMEFPVNGSIQATFYGLALDAVQVGPRLALLYCVEAEACGVAGQQGPDNVSRAGGELAYSAQISIAQPGFTAECSAMRNRVDAIIIISDAPTLSRLARDCLQQGVDLPLFTSSLALVPSALQDPNLEGLRATGNTFPWMLADGPAAPYAAALQTYAPNQQGTPNGSLSWQAARLFEAAARSVPADRDVTSEDIIEGLYALQNETLDGLIPPVTYNRDAPPSQVPCYLQIQIQGGQFTAPNGFDYSCF